MSGRDARTIEVAERVARALEERGVRCALIGAMALAAHGYSRATEDVDLGTAADPFTALAAARSDLEKEGWSVAFAAALPSAELREVCARSGLSDALERALAEVGAGGDGPASAP